MQTGTTIRLLSQHSVIRGGHRKTATIPQNPKGGYKNVGST
jgi:hypothetical protein